MDRTDIFVDVHANCYTTVIGILLFSMGIEEDTIIHQAKCESYGNVVDTQGLLGLFCVYGQLAFLDFDSWFSEV